MACLAYTVLVLGESSAAVGDLGAFIHGWQESAGVTISLLQVRANVSTGSGGAEGDDAVAEADGDDEASSPSCSELVNHGSYFSVPIEVGTPTQTFDVVADTGSDAVIIPSCLCQDSGSCSAGDRCFTGRNSRTFTIGANDQVPVINMEFGSGSIEAAVTTDVVHIGTVKTSMSRGLLLMVDRHLDITGQFEGILGLGQLQAEYSHSRGLDVEAASWDKPPTYGPQDANAENIYGFLRQANVERFSVCFNDGTSPGILRLRTERQVAALPSVGTLHWGLNFRGLSVGSVHAPALFCGDDDVSAGKECGAIPDSGTTVMLGPEEHVRKTFSSLCEQWPRCEEASRNEFPFRKKEEVFQLVLRRCEEWLNEGSGLDELPSIHMHLGSADDPERARTVELTAWSFVFETPVEQAEEHSKLLGTVGLSFSRLRGEERSSYVCSPAFGTSDYSSSGSGPVWIVGTPLFYEYVVGFDRSTSPPEVSFSTELCSSCAAPGSLSLVDGFEGRQRRTLEAVRSPRKIHGPLRIGRFPGHLPM